MTSPQKTLLLILSNVLFGKCNTFEDVDWPEVYQESKVQAVSLLAYEIAKKQCHLNELMQKWNKTALGLTAENIRVFHNHTLLGQWMTDANIPYVILKGCVSASYYHEPLLRCMGDVDFLIPTKYISIAETVLDSKGLKKLEKRHISHIVYYGEKAHYELHFNIPGIPNGEIGDVVRDYFSDIFVRAEHQNGDCSCTFPSTFHHGLILLLHTIHHMTGEGVGLRHLCDWAVFENSITNADFIRLFEEPLKRIGLWRFAKLLTSICIRYLGADYKEWASDTDEIIQESLIEDILNSGNFGRKDINRKTETYLISSRGKNGVAKISQFRQLFVSVNDIVYLQYPLIKKTKILLPFGWILFGINHTGRIIRRKSNIPDIGRVYIEASKRRELYSRLGIFETT